MTRNLDAHHLKLGFVSGLVVLLGSALSYVAAIARPPFESDRRSR